MPVVQPHLQQELHSDLLEFFSKLYQILADFEYFYIRNWSNMTTHIVLVVVLVGGDRVISSKKPKVLSFEIGSGWNFGSNVLQVNMHRLTESDFRFNVTFFRWRPWCHFRKVLSPGECIQSVRPPAMQEHQDCEFLNSYSFRKLPPALYFFGTTGVSWALLVYMQNQTTV